MQLSAYEDTVVALQHRGNSGSVLDERGRQALDLLNNYETQLVEMHEQLVQARQQAEEAVSELKNERQVFTEQMAAQAKRHARHVQQSVLAVEATWAQKLAEERSSMQKELEQMLQAWPATLREIEQCQEATHREMESFRKELENVEAAKEKEIRRLDGALQEHRQALTEKTAEAEGLSAALFVMGEEKQGLNRQIAGLMEELNVKTRACEDLRQRVKELTDQLASGQTALQAAKEENVKQDAELKAAQERLSSALQRMKQLELDLEDSTDHVQDLRARVRSASQREAALKSAVGAGAPVPEAVAAAAPAATATAGWPSASQSQKVLAARSEADLTTLNAGPQRQGGPLAATAGAAQARLAVSSRPGTRSQPSSPATRPRAQSGKVLPSVPTAGELSTSSNSRDPAEMFSEMADLKAALIRSQAVNSRLARELQQLKVSGVSELVVLLRLLPFAQLCFFFFFLCAAERVEN